MTVTDVLPETSRQESCEVPGGLAEAGLSCSADGQGTASGTNPLVAEVTESENAWTGSRLLEDGHDLVEAFESGDWVAGGLAAAAAVVDTVSMVMDPLGEAIAAGVAWVIEHLGCLNEWLEELTGDSDAVAAAASTWANISSCLGGCADDLEASLNGTLASQQSVAVAAYKSLQAGSAAHLRVCGQVAAAVSGSLTVASLVVRVVHDLVRDAISDVIGKVASKVVITVCTAGLAAGWAVASVLADVAEWAARLSKDVANVVRTFGNLGDLVKRADGLLDSVSKKFRSICDDAMDTVNDLLGPQMAMAGATPGGRSVPGGRGAKGGRGRGGSGGGKPKGDKPKDGKSKSDKPKDGKSKGDKPKDGKSKGDKSENDNPEDGKTKDGKPKKSKGGCKYDPAKGKHHPGAHHAEHGTTDGGPGVWDKGKNLSGSQRSMTYEEQVTGVWVQDSYYVNGVEFDGYRDGTLLDAKGEGMYDLSQRPWGKHVFEEMKGSGIRQTGAVKATAPGTPIEWHIAEEKLAEALRRMQARGKFSPDIKVIYTPPNYH